MHGTVSVKAEPFEADPRPEPFVAALYNDSKSHTFFVIHK
jgi:hypothetical protein